MNEFLDIFGDVMRLVTFQPKGGPGNRLPQRNAWTGADRSRRHPHHRP